MKGNLPNVALSKTWQRGDGWAVLGRRTTQRQGTETIPKTYTATYKFNGIKQSCERRYPPAGTKLEQSKTLLEDVWIVRSTTFIRYGYPKLIGSIVARQNVN